VFGGAGLSGYRSLQERILAGVGLAAGCRGLRLLRGPLPAPPLPRTCAFPPSSTALGRHVTPPWVARSSSRGPRQPGSAGGRRCFCAAPKLLRHGPAPAAASRCRPGLWQPPRAPWGRDRPSRQGPGWRWPRAPGGPPGGGGGVGGAAAKRLPRKGEQPAAAACQVPQKPPSRPCALHPPSWPPVPWPPPPGPAAAPDLAAEGAGLELVELQRLGGALELRHLGGLVWTRRREAAVGAGQWARVGMRTRPQPRLSPDQPPGPPPRRAATPATAQPASPTARRRTHPRRGRRP
jgi:hypothetical protein